MSCEAIAERKTTVADYEQRPKQASQPIFVSQGHFEED